MSYSLPSEIVQLLARIAEKNPAHRKHLDKVVPRISVAELGQLQKYISFCMQTGGSLDYLADSYLLLVADAVNEMMHFERHRKYRYSTFKEVADHVYFNQDYMNQYMYGLAISLYLWPSHLEIHRFFEETLPAGKPGNYLEVGPGHGGFLMTAMQKSSYASFLGIDISDTSIAQTQAVLDYFAPERADCCSLLVQDFQMTNLQPGSFDAVVMGEVLEHVEEPGMFLDKIHELAKTDAYIFVTTCVNAPQIDHIYLFRDLDEIAKLIGRHGFSIVTSKAIPYEGKTLQQCVERSLPINVAYVLLKDASYARDS